MTIEQLERAKCIVSCIRSADDNIAKFNKFLELSEIAICDNEHKCDDYRQLNKIYVSGDELKKVMQVLIDHWQTFKEKHEKELSEL